MNHVPTLLLALPWFATLACASTPNRELGPAPAEVLGIVEVPSPWYATRGLIGSKMGKSVDDYESLQGLNFKYFTIAGDGSHYGGLYGWESEAAAQAFYTATWRAEIRERRGSDPQLRLLEVRRTFTGPTALGGPARGERSAQTSASVVVVRAEGCDSPAAADAMARAPRLVQGFEVTLQDKACGVVGVFEGSSRQLAPWAERTFPAGVESVYDVPVALGAVQSPVTNDSPVATDL